MARWLIPDLAWVAGPPRRGAGARRGAFVRSEFALTRVGRVRSGLAHGRRTPPSNSVAPPAPLHALPIAPLRVAGGPAIQLRSGIWPLTPGRSSCGLAAPAGGGPPRRADLSSRLSFKSSSVM